MDSNENIAEIADLEDEDIVFLTPLDECIPHKPKESKFDILSGTIPFRTNVII